jgi:hypothetical protein
MISTRSLDLPEIDILKGRLQSFAVLDSILSQDWEFRYYSFNSNWDENTSLASIRNGSGDHLFIVFCSYGCLIKGFNHEAFMNIISSQNSCLWPGIIDTVPIEFQQYLQEAAFSPEETTFCIWRSYLGNSWEIGEIDFPSTPDPDGSESLLPFVSATRYQYQQWAEEYYEISIKIESIDCILSHQLLTESIIYEINSQASIQTLNKDLQEIGYLSSI